MRKLIYNILITLILISITLGSTRPNESSSLKIISWNIQNFGKSKTPEEIHYMAMKIKDADVVGIQEVSTTEHGINAVIKLDKELDQTGTEWDYAISDKTDGPGAEKYVYFWKRNKMHTLSKGLAKNKDDFDREPFIITFKTLGNKKLTLVNIHVVPTSKNPANEIGKLNIIAKDYQGSNIIFMGDFNISEKDKSFNTLKSLGFKSALINQKTSLKIKPKDGEILNEEYDNFLFLLPTYKVRGAGLIEFYKDFKTLKETREISDHCPIFITIK